MIRCVEIELESVTGDFYKAISKTPSLYRHTGTRVTDVPRPVKIGMRAHADMRNASSMLDLAPPHKELGVTTTVPYVWHETQHARQPRRERAAKTDVSDLRIGSSGTGAGLSPPCPPLSQAILNGPRHPW